MNGKQKVVAALAGTAALAMLLFPPFQYSLPNGVALNLGYAFVGSPPTPSGFVAAPKGSVNVTMLLTQIVGLLVAATAIGFALKTKEPGAPASGGS